MTIQSAYGASVQFNNPTSNAFITSNPLAFDIPDSAPDGSIRFQFTTGDPTAHLEAKASGVWNDTGLRLASSSLLLGHDLRVSAVGGFVESLNISEILEHLRALLPHIQFDTLGTTNQQAHMPILDIREDLIIFPGPSTGEILGKVIGQVFSAIPTRVLHSATHEVGSISSTSQVQVSYYKGTDNTGPLLNRFNIPANAMVADQPLTIVYDSDFGFENATNIFFEFVSAKDIALKTNVSGDVITTQNGHILAEEDILLDMMAINREAGLTLDREGNFVVGRYF